MNFDFEGEGSGDQTGLTNLITAVAGSLRAADPHWQITMDTYASSAGDPGGFYDIPALAPAVDAFFVMDYELNLAGTASAASPLTSGMFSSQTTLAQYTAAVPASKVILGTPFFGIDWPTNNGTMAATATGGATDIPDSQAAGNGPEYWDPVTDTAWTSYQVGGQWHESYYEGENGLFDVAQLATKDGARGVGIWALGMENDGAQMIAALDGISPGAPPGTGPQSTSPSAAAAAAPAPGPGAPPPAAASPCARGDHHHRVRGRSRLPSGDARRGAFHHHDHGRLHLGRLQRRHGRADPRRRERGAGPAGGRDPDRLPDQRGGLRVSQRVDNERLRQRQREAGRRGDHADELHRAGLPAALTP